jgi:hypothetical protein
VFLTQGTTQLLGVCYVPNAPLDIGEHSAQPFSVEPMLKIKVFEKVKPTSCRS